MPLDIQVTGTGNQVFLVRILCRQLVADQVAAVVEIFAVHMIVFYRMPSGRFYAADAAALLGWHRIRAYGSIGGSAAAEAVQITVNSQRIRLSGRHP